MNFDPATTKLQTLVVRSNDGDGTPVDWSTQIQINEREYDKAYLQLVNVSMRLLTDCEEWCWTSSWMLRSSVSARSRDSWALTFCLFRMSCFSILSICCCVRGLAPFSGSAVGFACLLRRSCASERDRFGIRAEEGDGSFPSVSRLKRGSGRSG